MSSNVIYQMVTDRIISLLEQNIVPWKQPWSNGNHCPVNWKTQKPYRGINTFLLPPGEFATLKQINEAGGRIKKGEKSHIAIFWTILEKEDEEGDKETIPLIRYYRVFEINSQCVGIKSRRKIQSPFDNEPIEEAEKIVKNYINGPKISHASGRAVYFPSIDCVSVPPLRDYAKVERYYSVLFHELVHSTGHEKRLNRKGIIEQIRFGSENYSKEELVAEIGAAMLCTLCHIDNATFDNSVSYIKGWYSRLKEDPKLIVQAAGEAQKAVDHIQGIVFDQNENTKMEQEV